MLKNVVVNYLKNFRLFVLFKKRHYPGLKLKNNIYLNKTRT